MKSGEALGWALDELASITSNGLFRTLEPLNSPQGAHVVIAGTALVNFSSNDYLGLANEGAVTDAFTAAARVHGVGTGASRLVVGDTTEHHALERELAAFEGSEAALLFNSGYAANVGVLSALVGAGDVIFSDELNHASIIDGCRLSRAKVVVYRHSDPEGLRTFIDAHMGARRRLVVTDSVFSMNGDLARLAELSVLCRETRTALMVDEAHATGVLGPTGAGLSSSLGIKPDLVMGTLSKAMGAMGAYVACPAAVRDLLINRARSLVFSTAMPAALCAAARVGLREVQRSERRERLWANINCLAAELGVEPRSSIFTVVLGTAEKAVKASLLLREKYGLLVKAIRPPTVPEGTSRLRIAVTAAHSRHDLELLCVALRELDKC